ncbi:MAG: hypothetical protein WC807_14780 [Hyphomicrobium sp.]|jgi:hypothetical protein
MTTDELIYAVNEAISQVEEYRQQILERHRGKIVKAYGEKVFRVDSAAFQHGHIWLRGSILKKDGTAHARHDYGLPVDDAEFVVPGSQ